MYIIFALPDYSSEVLFLFAKDMKFLTKVGIHCISQVFPWHFYFMREHSLAELTEGFNDWGGRGYDYFVPGEVTKTAPSGDETT